MFTASERIYLRDRSYIVLPTDPSCLAKLDAWIGSLAFSLCIVTAIGNKDIQHL